MPSLPFVLTHPFYIHAHPSAIVSSQVHSSLLMLDAWVPLTLTGSGLIL